MTLIGCRMKHVVILGIERYSHNLNKVQIIGDVAICGCIKFAYFFTLS